MNRHCKTQTSAYFFDKFSAEPEIGDKLDQNFKRSFLLITSKRYIKGYNNKIFSLWRCFGNKVNTKICKGFGICEKTTAM